MVKHNFKSTDVLMKDPYLFLDKKFTLSNPHCDNAHIMITCKLHSDSFILSSKNLMFHLLTFPCSYQKSSS
jgi:hypothetical protein